MTLFFVLGKHWCFGGKSYSFPFITFYVQIVVECHILNEKMGANLWYELNNAFYSASLENLMITDRIQHSDS
jgi:hypothetical protein